MRQRDGKTPPFVIKNEVSSLPIIYDRVQNGSTVFADETTS